jgi:tRNA pseudouridine55 synthase
VDGILNLNKPSGWTSHDVVARVRRLTGVRRVGHAGTLDPLATGVLLVGLGQATRISEYLMAGRKRYRAVVRLGVSTDSHDADGQVTATAPVTATRAHVEAALAGFRGRIDQVPPMVSALKRDGQPLYKLARRGVAVERQPRPVDIFELALTDWAPPDLTLELTCSPGTYVRALARDLGQILGCGAHLTELTRLASGNFTLEQAVRWEQFEAAVADGSWRKWVSPIDAGLQSFPACDLDAQESQRVQHGLPLSAGQVAAPPDALCRAYDPERRLLALLRFDTQADVWRPHKVFRPQ